MGGGGGWPAGLLGGAQGAPETDYISALGRAAAPQSTATPAPTGEGYSNLGGFITSGLAAIPGLIGIGPERLPGIDAAALRDWESQHPWLATGASLATLAIPYTAGARLGAMALRSIPMTSRLLGSVAANSPRALQAPVSTAIAAGLLELAPFETARVGAAAAFGDPGSLREVGTAIAMDLGLQIGFSTVGGLYRSLRTRTEDEVLRGAIGPQYNGRAAPQERLGQLYEWRAGNPTLAPEMSSRADSRVLQLEGEIRAQTPVRGENYVNRLWNGSNTRDVRRLFNPGEFEFAPEAGGGGLRRQTLTVGKNGFETEAEWRAVAEEAGLPEGFLADVQYPRVISGTTDAAINRVRGTLNKNLRTARNGWLIEQEANSRLFVMGRELQNGRFMLLKTANPNALLGEDVFQRVASRAEGYIQKVESPVRRRALNNMSSNIPDSVYGQMSSARNVFTADLMEAAEKAGSAEAAYKLIPGSLQRAGKTVQDFTDRTWQWTKKYLSPANFEFKGLPQAEAARLTVQHLVDVSKGKATVMMRGSPALGENQSWISSIIRPGPAGGFEGLVKSGLQEGDLPALDSILRRNMNLEAARRELAGMDDLVANRGNERIYRVLEELEKMGVTSDGELSATQALYGKATHTPVDGHFGMTHLWRGEFRHTITDDAGVKIGVGTGRTAQEATQNAVKLSKRLGGKPVEEGAERTRSFRDDEILAQTIYGNLNKRGVQVLRNTLDDRTAAFGGGDTTPLTKQDLLDLVAARIQDRYEQIPRTIVKNDIQHDVMHARARYGDTVGDQLQYRVDRMLGNKGEIDRYLNQKLQKMMPFLGNNAADKLVQGYNRLEAVSTLYTSFAYPIMQFAQTFQAVLPRLAWLRNANAGQMQDFYGFVPIIEGGKTRGFMGVLDPALLVAKGIRAIARPDSDMQAMFQRAQREGVVSSGIHQEFVGPGSHYGNGWRAAYKNRGVVGAMEFFMGWPARKAEELTRAHTFATGVEFARRLGVRDPEQIYLAAKQITNKTSYQFTVADRSRVFNGPLGSAVGLFKNWTMNNMADWATYAGSAAKRGQIAPLAWAAAGNTALAGVGGLPLIAVADYMQKLFSDRGLIDQIYGAQEGPDGNNVADAIYFGLPTLLGISLQSQLSAPMTDPMRDLNFLFNWTLLDRAHKVSTLVQHTIGSWRATGDPFSDPRTLDMLNYAVGPRMMYKGLSEIQDGMIVRMRDGRHMLDQPLGTVDRILHTLGFTPTRVAQAYEVSGRMYESREARNAATRRLGAAMATAIDNNDYDTQTFITQRAIATGADLGSVLRSAQARVRRQHLPVLPGDLRRDPITAELFAALELGQ